MQIFSAIIARKKGARVKRGREVSGSERLADQRDLPAYAIAEAAHCLRIPVATLRSWVRPRIYRTEPNRKHFKPLITLPDSRLGALSFVNLVEAHVLQVVEGGEAGAEVVEGELAAELA